MTHMTLLESGLIALTSFALFYFLGFAIKMIVSKTESNKVTREVNEHNIRILCIIGARSGSKGIKDKNIMLFNGKPLMAHSIEQAKETKYYKKGLMRVIVSTDSEKYATIANDYGAETPFLRPKEISADHSIDIEFVEHAINWLKHNENYKSDIILQLRPTQPLRKVKDINKCLDIFIQKKNSYDSLRTVIENTNKTPFKMYQMKNKELIPLFYKIDNIIEPYNNCRQYLPKTYTHNGYIDIFNTDIVINKNTISGQKIYPYVMKATDDIDIDTVHDYIKAQNAIIRDM